MIFHEKVKEHVIQDAITRTISKPIIKLPSLMDATLLLALLSGGGYIATYFAIMTTYYFYNIPAIFCEVSINKIIETSGIYYCLAVVLIFFAFILNSYKSVHRLTNFTQVLMDRLWIPIYWGFITIIVLSFYLSIPDAWIVIIFLSGCGILFFLDKKKKLSMQFITLRKKIGDFWFLIVTLFSLLPLISALIMFMALSQRQEFLEVINKKTFVKEDVQANHEERLSDDGSSKVKLILGEYDDQFIVRTVIIKKDLGNKMVVDYYLPDIELIPKKSDYVLRVVRFDEPIPRFI